MATPVKEIAAGTSKTFSGLREAVQDLVAPDLRAVKVSIDALTQELRLRTESLSNEIKLRHDSLEKEMKSLRGEMRPRDENQSKSIRALTDAITHLAQKIDGMNIDLREPVAVLETRMTKQ